MAEEPDASGSQEDPDPFLTYRDILFGISYRMLGTVTDAEDVVQETWLRWHQADPATVDNPRGYLVRAVTRTAIDHLRRSKARREEYVGPWLPEPLLTTPDISETAVLDDSLSMAVLVVLEALSPVERAVFVLHEAFGFPYPEVAAAVGRSESAVRQIGHRSRKRVQHRQQRFRPGRAELNQAVQRFAAASLGGDLEALLEMLAPDVVLHADGGGKGESPRVPLHGAGTVAEFIVSVAGLYPPGVSTHVADANGRPAVVVVIGGAVFAVVSVDLAAADDGWRITAVHTVRNPEKLTRVPAAP